MADFLTEVDEMMRQERVMKFWQENASFIIVLVVATIVITAAISGYKTWNYKVKAEQTSTVNALFTSPEFPDNVLQDDLDLRGGLKGIVLLNGAGTFLENGKTGEALTLYGRAANDNAVPDDLRQLAALTRVRIMSGNTDADTASLLKDLQEIWSDSNSPWRYHAHLEAAILSAHNNEDYETARKHLAAVLNDSETIPAQISARAQALDHVYALEKPKKTDNKNTSDPS